MAPVKTLQATTFGRIHDSMEMKTICNVEVLQNSVATLVNTKQLCKPHEGATEPSYLNDGECLKFASSLDYFIYCCCYEKMEPCGYLHNRAQSTHNMSLNFNEWTTDFGLTSYKSDSKWTFASFLYSRRTGLVLCHFQMNSVRLDSSSPIPSVLQTAVVAN